MTSSLSRVYDVIKQFWYRSRSKFEILYLVSNLAEIFDMVNFRTLISNLNQKVQFNYDFSETNAISFKNLKILAKRSLTKVLPWQHRKSYRSLLNSRGLQNTEGKSWFRLRKFLNRVVSARYTQYPKLNKKLKRLTEIRMGRVNVTSKKSVIGCIVLSEILGHDMLCRIEELAFCTNKQVMIAKKLN